MMRELFMRWLVENEVNLVLHGHMHLPALVKESRALDFRNRKNGTKLQWQRWEFGRGDGHSRQTNHIATALSNSYVKA